MEIWAPPEPGVEGGVPPRAFRQGRGEQGRGARPCRRARAGLQRLGRGRSQPVVPPAQLWGLCHPPTAWAHFRCTQRKTRGPGRALGRSRGLPPRRRGTSSSRRPFLFLSVLPPATGSTFCISPVRTKILEVVYYPPPLPMKEELREGGRLEMRVLQPQSLPHIVRPFLSLVCSFLSPGPVCTISPPKTPVTDKNGGHFIKSPGISALGSS